MITKTEFTEANRRYEAAYAGRGRRTGRPRGGSGRRTVGNHVTANPAEGVVEAFLV